MKITYYGHNTLGIETSGTHLLIDPFITGNENAKDKVDIKSLKADYILLTHAHQDHILDAEAIAKNTGAIIISNYEVANHYGEKDIEAMPMNQGGTRTFDFGTIKYVKAIHSSSFADGSYGGNPGGFVIKGKEKSIYVAGDTALTMDMKLIPMFAKLDLAVLPIGDTVTMGADEAIKACDFIECDEVLGVHYDTFPFIQIDKDLCRKKFDSAGKELHLLEIGDSMDV